MRKTIGTCLLFSLLVAALQIGNALISQPGAENDQIDHTKMVATGDPIFPAPPPSSHRLNVSGNALIAGDPIVPAPPPSSHQPEVIGDMLIAGDPIYPMPPPSRQGVNAGSKSLFASNPIVPMPVPPPAQWTVTLS